VPVGGAARGAGLTDTLYFGDAAGEKAHAVSSDNSEVRAGGLGRKCRVILPAKPPSASGGSVGFTIGCDPARQNYLTARLWGSDVGDTVLYLVHEGRQIGCNHSDWPALDKLNWRVKRARFGGRFFYSTYLLPRGITRGRSRITLRIAARGLMYSYARSYEKGQHLQKTASQGIYAVYTHTEAFFRPPAGEAQGRAARLGPVFKPDSELGPYEYARQHAQRTIDAVLRRKLSPTREIHGIATAYGAAWAKQHKDKAVLARVIETVDTYVLRNDIPSLGWFGAGEMAEAVCLVYHDARRAGHFAGKIGPAGKTRAEAYADFFRRAVDYRTEPKNRGGLANQDIYVNTGIYRANMLLKKLKKLKKLAPARALPEAVAMDYVYQAVGLRPYKGRFYRGKGEQLSTAYRFSVGGPIFLSDRRDYYWVTPAGSSKEHGYVCEYGEMAEQTATLYELTGDEKVKAQAIRMVAARAPFRVFANDHNGNAAVCIEAVVGWRHNWYPGRVEYADQYLKAAALLGDPISMRLAQLYVAHGMVYKEPYRPGLGLLVQRVGYLKKVLAAPPSAFRFPMRDDRADFAWADPGIRAIAFKHKGRRCWMVMNWRAAGINNIARVHYTERAVDRIANIRIDTKFTPRGKFIVRPAERCSRDVFVKPGTRLATDGQKLPLAAGSLGGAADFYTARYGEYLIGMNCTGDRTFELTVPPEFASSRLADLIAGKTLAPAAAMSVAPNTTVILHLARATGPRLR